MSMNTYVILLILKKCKRQILQEIHDTENKGLKETTFFISILILSYINLFNVFFNLLILSFTKVNSFLHKIIQQLLQYVKRKKSNNWGQQTLNKKCIHGF